jgi:hypothetical protein
MQQQYDEDKLKVLDIAKEAIRYNVMPQYQYMYNPGMFHVGAGQISLPSTKNNVLLNNPLSKFISKKITGSAWWTEPYQSDIETKKTFGGGRTRFSNAKSATKTFINKIANPFGLELNNGRFGLNDLSYEQGAWYKHFQGNIDGQTTKAIARISKAEQLGVDYLANSPVGSMDVRRAKVMKYLDRVHAKYGSIAAAKGSFGNVVGSWGSTAARGIGRLGFKAGVAGLKVGAAVGVASLAFGVANMVFNPIGQAAVQAVDNAFSKMDEMRRPNLGGEVSLSYLSSGAATERQRAIQAISKSRMNGRAALGHEASYMH